MTRSLAKLAGVLAVAAAVGVSVPAAPAAPVRTPIQALAAKTCHHGFKKGKIDGSWKCLEVGEFCRRSADRQYRHYGFRCIRYYRNVNRYRLTYA